MEDFRGNWSSKMLILLLAVFAILVVWYFLRAGSQVEIPKGDAQPISTTVIQPDGMEKSVDILETDGTKHSIPLEDILSGGPPKDGIPSIDEPTVVSASDVPEWFDRNGLGVSLSINDVNRFYPYQVLVGHEIVNDIINGQRVLATYCPLCFTGIVFDPVVGNDRVEFGVSGKLWNSNLLMYNREGKDESLWSQISGKAVVGEHTGEVLPVIPSDIARFSDWQQQFPNGDVVIGGDDHPFRTYTSTPYGGDLENIQPFFPVDNQDSRLGENAFVMGLEIDGQFKAYHVPAVVERGNFTDTFAGRTIDVEYDPELKAVRLFDVTDGGRQRLTPFPSFWFSWVAVHPETELFRLSDEEL